VTLVVGGSSGAKARLFAAAWTLVWKLLDRFGLCSADRADLVQDVLIAAYRARAKYDPDRGSPQQWLSGIARREVKRFLRVRDRSAFIVARAELPDSPDGAPSPEDDVARTDPPDDLLFALPDAERRAVILVEIEGLTMRKAAEREGVSASTVYERHRKGMAALRCAVTRSREQEVLGKERVPLVFLGRYEEVIPSSAGLRTQAAKRDGRVSRRTEP
jgi:RNA polymerase sigma-70 factor (ECF subfamily)